LKQGLSLVLVFVGAKMLLTDIYKIPVLLSLGVVAAILAISVIVSLLRPATSEAPNHPAQPAQG
jgi:tellurite resistance protein TerC